MTTTYRTVSAVTAHPDGSVTVFGHDAQGFPLVRTFPAGEVLSVGKGGAK